MWKYNGSEVSMKIVLLEPLGISEDKLEKLANEVESKGHSFTAYKDVTVDTEELKQRSKGADVLMIANHPLPDEVIDSCEDLKMVSVAFVGIDHVGTEACKRRGISVYNTGGYCDDAVAELAVGLALDHMRNISRGNESVQSGGGKAGLQGNELRGKTVGIIGTGSIGCRTAEIFSAFGCKLIGYSRSERTRAKEIGIEYHSLREVMERSDIISIHTPLTSETKGLIGKEEIDAMKPGAILINTSRGPVVDTEAAAAALRDDRIKYGTDVYEKDPPLPEGHPFIDAPNLICTPHVGFDTEESIDRRADMVFENIDIWMSGGDKRKML